MMYVALNCFLCLDNIAKNSGRIWEEQSCKKNPEGLIGLFIQVFSHGFKEPRGYRNFI